MPVYEYKCDRCEDIIIEFFWRFKDSEEFLKEKHENCGGNLKKIMSVPSKPIIH